LASLIYGTSQRFHLAHKSFNMCHETYGSMHGLVTSTICMWNAETAWLECCHRNPIIL
jgi:hypothetical protein